MKNNAPDSNKADLSQLAQRLSNIDLQEIDFKNAGSWPKIGKLLFLALIFSLTLLLGYFLYLLPLNQTLDRAQKKEQQLITAFETKAFQGANLAAYQQQMLEIQGLIKTLNSQLPNDNAIPELIEQIGEQAKNNRVEIKALKLQTIEKKEAYIAQPIQLEIYGSFHNLSLFISSLTALQRIVTLHDFTLRPQQGLLSLNIRAMAYHNQKPNNQEESP